MITDAYGASVTTEIVTLTVERFSDVKPGAFYYDPVLWAVENGITTGQTSSTFAPENACMRWHMVMFLWRTAGCPESTLTYNPFTDVAEGDTFYKAALWAYEKGITTVTTFKPYETLNRWQTVLFLWRAMGSPEPESSENPFTDVSENAQYYKAALWARENNITDVNTFAPDATCTRGHIVTFIYRAIHVNGMTIK